MNTSYESLVVSVPGAAAQALKPGRIALALRLGAGVSAGELGTIRPLGRGRVAVEIALERALRRALKRLFKRALNAS